MTLNIITPTFATEYQIAWLELTTASGSLIIHQGHAPTILAVTPYSQIIFKLKTGKQQTITVDHGIVHVNRKTIEAILNPIE